MANDTGERQQYLRLLSFMDATFPASTKLPTHVLRERLVKALDLSQMLTELFGAKGPKLNTLKRWDRRKLLTHGMAHYSSEESSEWGMDNSNIDPFNEVRSTIPEAIAYGYDSGWTSLFYYFEKGGGRDIRVEFKRAYRVVQENAFVVPLVTVRCSFGSVEDCAQDANDGWDDGVAEMPIEMSSDAIVLFRLLLESNAARMAQGTHKPGTSGTINSFLLPLNKLTPKDIASVCKDVGCSVCGNPVKSRCSRCQSIGYCGTECQRSDWKRHKSTCKLVDEGDWIRMKYGRYFCLSDRDCNAGRIPAALAGEPTVYGNDPFLVRIHASRYFDGNIELFVGDRRETFTGLLARKYDPINYLRLSLALDEIHGRTKVYLWARYLGNSTLSIRLDPKPDQSMLAW